jgi:putative ABC transport system ATP-binding protein
MTPILELNQVGKVYTLPSGEELAVLRDLDLALAPGELVAVVGRSGSGKSTLLNILGLLDRPSSGACRIDGGNVSTLSDAKTSALRGRFLGFIFQQFHLLDRRTALENVAEPMLYAGAAGLSDRKRRAMDLLGQVGLSERADSMPHMLSGGEQQRVAIARALVRQPRVVLADEPTGALDVSTGRSVLDLLIDLVRSEGVTLVLVTHDREIAGRADRVLELANGRLAAMPA